jgi:hypothetical protein
MHKFSIGEKVDFVPAFHQRYAPTSEYKVVRQLPDHNGEFFYQIKSAREPHDRVVGESQLARPAPAAEPVSAPPKRRASSGGKRKSTAPPRTCERKRS